MLTLLLKTLRKPSSRGASSQRKRTSCNAQEMYFRHLYAIQQPPLEARAESWANYTALFGVILHGNVNMQLPNGWLWDMIDEFVYQFQSFAQYRGKLSMKSAEEVRSSLRM